MRARHTRLPSSAHSVSADENFTVHRKSNFIFAIQLIDSIQNAPTSRPNCVSRTTTLFAMDPNFLNSIPDAPPSTPEAADNQPKRTKTMTEAALAANRANALKSTGPRTASGKARSASNAFQHGLYSMRSFTHLLGDPNLVLTVEHNFLQEYEPVTPTEHMLVQQLIHLQLRFLQMENFFNQAYLIADHEKPTRAYLAVLRELDRIPNRILKVIKAIQQQIALRNPNAEIEPIEDPPRVETLGQLERQAKAAGTYPSGPKLGESISEYIYQEYCRRMGITPKPYEPRPDKAQPDPQPAQS